MKTLFLILSFSLTTTLLAEEERWAQGPEIKAMCQALEKSLEAHKATGVELDKQGCQTSKMRVLKNPAYGQFMYGYVTFRYPNGASHVVGCRGKLKGKKISAKSITCRSAES